MISATAAAVVMSREDGPPIQESGAAPATEGLVRWPARGDLAHDRAFHKAAAAVWHSSDSQVKDTYVLWAGHASGGRLALLQVAVGVERLIAIVADGSVPDARAVFVVEYGGPLPPQQAVDGTTMRTLRLLVPPGTRSVDRRGVPLASTAPDQFSTVTQGAISLADWHPLQLEDGLTSAWLEPAGGALTAVRFDQRTEAAQLVSATPGLGLSPEAITRWSGEPVREARDYPAAVKAEESLALAQVMRSFELEVRVIGPGDEYGRPLYAVRRSGSVVRCFGCTEVYAVRRGDPKLGEAPTTSVVLVSALVSEAGTVLIQDSSLTGYRLLWPGGAARCVFGTHVPPAPTAPEEAITVIGAEKYDGSYVCVDARGKVIDRSSRNSGFAAVGD